MVDTTRGTYIEGVLHGIAGVDSHDTENLIVMMAWMRCEESLCNFNPYGCSKAKPGSKQCRYVTTAAVQEYPDWSTGVQATSEMIQQQWVTDIVGALRNKSMTAEAKANVIGLSGWNTGPNHPDTTVTARNVYRARIVAQCAVVRLNVQATMQESLPGQSTTNPNTGGGVDPGLGLPSLPFRVPNLHVSVPWATGLGNALSWLTDSAHWWQIGRVALGVALASVGFFVVFSDIKPPPMVGGAVSAVKAVA